MELWQSIFSKNIRTLEKLKEALPSLEESGSLDISPDFPINIPWRIVNKIKQGDFNDPLLKQFVPFKNNETLTTTLDPVQDASFCKTPQLLQKYHGRALIITTGVCPMHCRYCFRQNFDYPSTGKTFSAELNYLKNDSSIHEVILSGGDPLSLPDTTLARFIEQIEAIPHITKIRFHTRFVIGIPERITGSFLSLLEKTRLQPFFVIHINHIRELDSDIIRCLKNIQKTGTTILSQTVLLKEINDDTQTLIELFTKLTDHGILPYYLHQLDLVKNADSFYVCPQKGKKLIEEIRKKLPGYAIPKYVEEIPFKESKTPIL